MKESTSTTQNLKFTTKNYCLLAVASCLMALFLSSCESELIRKQEEQISGQQEEIMRQRREIEDLKVARQREEQKRLDCNRAFRDFEKAQVAQDPQEAVALYRQGLRLCPDDDVAHYELGKILRGIGRNQEAKEEFEAALKINPNFHDAKRQLETIK
ncbi:MAG: tetratricopeptide repeat protein [Deltaproteobacteria bacterium]|nr:tetratricopeptide repeat protein [Deltaproteobacteria bacterium]